MKSHGRKTKLSILTGMVLIYLINAQAVLAAPFTRFGLQRTAGGEKNFSLTLLGFLGGLTVLGGVIIGFISWNQLKRPSPGATRASKAGDTAVFLFSMTATLFGVFALQAAINDPFTIIVQKEVQIPVEVTVEVTIEPDETDLTRPVLAEIRVEEWQAQMPPEYFKLENPFGSDPDAIKEGSDAFFEYRCTLCHGLALDGNGYYSPALTPKPVDLTDPGLMNLPFVSDAYLFWRISEGGAQPPYYSAMPAWRHIISEDVRWQLVSFIRSQTRDDSPGIRTEQAAVAIIEKAGCFACHRLESLGRGGQVGPAWDGVGAAASTRESGLSAEAYIRQSIVEPGAYIVPDYPNIMPPNFAETLSADEIDVLVQFLAEQVGD